LFEVSNNGQKLDTRTNNLVKLIDVLRKETKTLFETKLDKADFNTRANESADVIDKIHKDLDKKESTM
jgi:hypothetical protein